MNEAIARNSEKAFRLPIRSFDWRQYVVYGGFVLIFLIFSVVLGEEGFLTTNNLLNIVRQTATITVIAVAMTFVIAAGEIDLSVGAIAGLASVATAMAIAKFGFWPGIFAGFGTGLLIGLINGTLVTKMGIPSFLVTLGMLGVTTGIAMWITGTAPVPIRDETYNAIFGSGSLGLIPSMVVWSIVMLVVGHVALRMTPYGRQVLATGGNEVAAAFSGVNTKRIKFVTLTLCGLAASLGGMLYAGRLHSGRFQWGQGDELSVIAAVILGGTSLNGGQGSVVGAVIGSLLIGLINNGLLLMGLEYSQQLIIRGVIIIVAVALARRNAK